jgi:hypothetical protein
MAYCQSFDATLMPVKDQAAFNLLNSYYTNRSTGDLWVCRDDARLFCDLIKIILDRRQKLYSF